MSQKSSRKTQSTTAISEEKEKQQSNSPLKDIKKKVAANAEKEKQAADKTDKPVEKNDKPVEKMDKPSKPVEKMDKQSKPAEKLDKSADKADKSIEKSDKSTEKATKTVDKTDKHEKTEKAADKKQEKTDKNDKKADKPVEKAELTDKKEGVQGDKNAKDKAVKPVNGTHNGSQPTNGADGTVSDSSEDDLVIEEDDVYPELTYDESDTDAFETDASRSLTRRSQSKEPKILKLTETPASDRKLRSADSPKPDAKKIEPQKKPQESKTNDASKGGQDEKNDSTKKEVEEKKDQKVEATSSKDDKSKHFEIDVVIELDSNEDDRRGKCRARVSPYSRPKLDLTTASLQANYTGNNTTMEMDITETSIEENPDDSGYLRGLRTIRGRTSYKKLAELPPITRTARPNLHNSSAPITLPESRPLGTVVGRKRKPSPEHDIEVGTEARDELFATRGKRVKLFDRITLPFMSRRAAEIVGINTDLPLTAPVASTSFDPETIKPTTPFTPQDPIITPITTQDRDGKRCIIM